jgi:uncharacterized protein with HEPN domain
MPFDPAVLPLHDIRENIRLAREFVGSATFETFATDRRTVYAVSRCLEIVPEAARRLPTDLRERHRHLPWRAIMDLGNVYRHEYRSVVEERIWRTVHGSLAPLADAVDAEIARANSAPPTAD